MVSYPGSRFGTLAWIAGVVIGVIILLALAAYVIKKKKSSKIFDITNAPTSSARYPTPLC